MLIAESPALADASQPVVASSVDADALFAQHSPWAVAVARGMVARSIRSRYALGQFDQAALIGLWKATLRYDVGRQADFRKYAVVLVRRAVADELRSLSWTRAACGDPVSLSDPELKEPIAAPVLENDHGDAVQFYCALLADPRLRLVILLRYGQGLSRTDAAAVIGTSNAWISKLERRALKAIREPLRIKRN